MPTNRWALGTMYYQGQMNGTPGFYSQPGGPNTQVFPTQKNAAPWPQYPIPGLVIQEFSPWFAPGCLHSIKFWKIIHEWDYTTDMDCALICCSLCSYVQRVIEPYNQVLNPIQNAIIV